MLISCEDKSTPQSVLLKFFIPAIFLNIFFAFSVPFTKYSDTEKNDLKWIGTLCGIIFPITFGLITIYIIRKYRALKKSN